MTYLRTSENRPHILTKRMQYYFLRGFDSRTVQKPMYLSVLFRGQDEILRLSENCLQKWAASSLTRYLEQDYQSSPLSGGFIMNCHSKIIVLDGVAKRSGILSGRHPVLNFYLFLPTFMKNDTHHQKYRYQSVHRRSKLGQSIKV